MLPVRAFPSVALILKANRVLMRSAIAASIFWRYGGAMGQSSRTELKHMARLLVVAATLSGCDNKTQNIRYDPEDRGIVMPEPKKADREKCYGIALAQRNDGADGPDSDYAGTAAEDYLPDHWNYVPTGSCAAAGGSLTPRKPDRDE